MDSLRSTYLVRKGKLGPEAHFGALPGALYFASVSFASWIVIPSSLFLQVSVRVHRIHNSAIYKST
jgi:hypothetical protein